MMAYAPQIKVRDRWAIVAYIRALMRSQNATSAGCPRLDAGGVESMSDASPPADPVSLPPRQGVSPSSRAFLAMAVAAGAAGRGGGGLRRSIGRPTRAAWPSPT